MFVTKMTENQENEASASKVKLCLASHIFLQNRRAFGVLVSKLWPGVRIW